MTRRARLALWRWLGWAVVSWNVAFAAAIAITGIASVTWASRLRRPR